MDTWLLCRQVDGHVCVCASCWLKHQLGELTDPRKAGGQAAIPTSQAGRQIALSQGKEEKCIS